MPPPRSKTSKLDLEGEENSDDDDDNMNYHPSSRAILKLWGCNLYVPDSKIVMMMMMMMMMVMMMMMMMNN